MNKDEIFNILYSKDKVEAYKKFQDIEQNKECLKILYKYFDDVYNMLFNEKSYIRVRGFRIMCKLSQYDKIGKINNIIEVLLKMLDEDKAICVRQYLASISNIIKYKPELTARIEEKLNNIDYMKYNESMGPLIKKDIENVLEYMK